MALPVTVVTVAYGGSGAVREWVRQWSSTGAACIITDNGNQLPDGIVSDATVLPFTGNTGFGRGINRAVHEADTELVLITNPDTLPENTASLSRLIEYHSPGTITGSTTVDRSGKEIHSSGAWPNRNWVRSQIFKKAESLWSRNQNDWLQGSLMMVCKDDFLKLGGFSSSYPLFFEDVDICARAEKQGMSIGFCRESRFIHNEGSGSTEAAATRISCFHWGMLEFFRNHDPDNADAVRKMIIAKCVFRLSAYALFSPRAFKGYCKALEAVVSGVSPTLPGALNG